VQATFICAFLFNHMTTQCILATNNNLNNVTIHGMSLSGCKILA